MTTRRYASNILLFLTLIAAACEDTGPEPTVRETIDLEGSWQVRLDTARVGIREHWQRRPFDDTVRLPGTLDENRKGFVNRDTTEMHLNRAYVYTGPAWFKKEIELPAAWQDRRVELVMERTKVTRVWLDTTYLGTKSTLFTPQAYDLTDTFTSGAHTLTILVDNDPELVPVAGSHAYSEDTQTNWNGILGRFYLEASNPVRMRDVRVDPDLQTRQLGVRVHLENPGVALQEAAFTLRAEAWNTDQPHVVPEQRYAVALASADTVVTLTYALGEDAHLWSEFDPALYKLTVTLHDGTQTLDARTLDVGMRAFTTKGTQFAINGLTTFLRGKHEAAVFPLTGYPPMDTSGWARVFRIAKSYGINHYRYHSWCPPEAAFQAADVTGIYLQPELPIWWGFNAQDATHRAFMRHEGTRILDAYGNHASFVLFALGNEIGQDRTALRQMVAGFRAHDDRPLYAQGSNNRLWDPSYAEGDDFWVTFRTSTEKPDLRSDVRTSIAFIDAAEAGILNTVYPSTAWTYEKAIEGVPVPVIGHEIGQYQIYPNYAEMAKYTGVLKPWNFEIFRRRLEDNGMLDQADAFFRASGAFSVINYRADIETALRTPGFGGFQLLDLQDYPGQGTALVGILDAFMDSKGLITPDAFRAFNDAVVPLLVMGNYTWTNDEPFHGEIKVANYGPTALNDQTVTWSLGTDEDASPVQSGSFTVSIPQGSLTTAGILDLSLDGFDRPQKASITIALDGTPYATSYPIWIYPAGEAVDVPEDITVATRLDAATLDRLDQGGRVLLFPDFEAIEAHSVGGMFIPDFWNFGMFKSLVEQFQRGIVSPGTLGILTDPTHPVFNAFPTEFHSNWQWWPIVKNSRPIILDDADAAYRPIVQVIDNINRNHKLGLIFEYRVGPGKLLVCASNLPALTDSPEARQLYTSLLHYMRSEDFNPATERSPEALQALFNLPNLVDQ